MLALAALAVLFLAPGLLAQAPYATNVNGVVTLRLGADGTVRPLENATTGLQTGDRITTGAKSTAVILLDGAHSFLIGPRSEVNMALVEAAQFRVDALSGAVTWHVEGFSSANVELGTPPVTLHPAQPGVYAVTIKPGGETEIIPREGRVEVFAPSGSAWVTAGQKMIARGDPANPEFRIKPAGSRFVRAMVLLSNVIQAIDVVSAIGDGGGGGGRQKTAGSSKPAPGGSAPHPPSHPPATPPATRTGK